MPVQNLLFHTQEIENTPREPSGVPLNSKSNVGNLICNLCGNKTTILTPTDFKDMIWTQRNKIQFITENEFLKNFNIELCGDCRKRIFKNSKITINFNLDLFKILKEVENGRL